MAPAFPQAPGAAEGEAAAAPGAVRGAEGTALPPRGAGRAPAVCAGRVRARLTPLSPPQKRRLLPEAVLQELQELQELQDVSAR